MPIIEKELKPLIDFKLLLITVIGTFSLVAAVSLGWAMKEGWRFDYEKFSRSLFGEENPQSASLTTLSDFQIKEIIPVQGSLKGGQTVIIKGGGFVEASKVYFGETEQGVKFADAHTLEVTTVPATQSALMTVSVVNPDGSVVQKKEGFLWLETGE